MFDPSKLSPSMISELTQLMRELKPEQIMKMQSLMHNQMAGFNVVKEMQEFEQSLPPGFREKMARLMVQAHGSFPSDAEKPVSAPTSEADARLVILKSVAQGLMTPEKALEVLFP